MRPEAKDGTENCTRGKKALKAQSEMSKNCHKQDKSYGNNGEDLPSVAASGIRNPVAECVEGAASARVNEGLGPQ
jgi:hypothetical protein